MLVPKKLSNNEVRVLPDKFQILVIESFLQPMLRPFAGGSALGDLKGPFVFTRRTMPENYHLEGGRSRKVSRASYLAAFLRKETKKNTSRGGRGRKSVD